MYTKILYCQGHFHSRPGLDREVESCEKRCSCNKESLLTDTEPLMFLSIMSLLSSRKPIQQKALFVDVFLVLP